MRFRVLLAIALFALGATARADTLRLLAPAADATLQQVQRLRGGMTLRRYPVKFPQKTLRVWTFTGPDGKLEQYMVAAAE